jgi:hypothetical protein
MRIRADSLPGLLYAQHSCKLELGGLAYLRDFIVVWIGAHNTVGVHSAQVGGPPGAPRLQGFLHLKQQGARITGRVLEYSGYCSPAQVGGPPGAPASRASCT